MEPTASGDVTVRALSMQLVLFRSELVGQPFVKVRCKLLELFAGSLGNQKLLMLPDELYRVSLLVFEPLLRLRDSMKGLLGIVDPLPLK